MKHETSLKI